MNINKEIKEDLTALITLNIAEEDYQPQVEQELKKYRTSASVKGFRKGKAPLGLIKKMAGKSILVQEVDKLVSNTISKYLKEENLRILGQPLPVNDQEPMDFDNDSNFKFSFEIGISPEPEITLDENIKVPYYNIEVDDDTIQKEIERICQQHGKLEETEEVTEKSYLKGDIIQSTEDGTIIPEGLFAENTTFAVDLIKDDDIKKEIIGKKSGDTISLDLKKAYPNDTEISAILNIEKETVADIEPHFNITINEINEFKPAQVGEELFEKLYEENEVKTEEDFKNKIKESIAGVYKKESDFRFGIDTKETLVDKFNPLLPDEFLRRWLLEVNREEKLTEEKLDEEYPQFRKDLQWRVINNQIAEEQKFEVNPEEVMEESKKFALMQLQQYGIDPNQLPEETLNQFAEKNMEKQEDRERFVEKVIENKVIDYIKSKIGTEEKTINTEDFKKLYE